MDSIDIEHGCDTTPTSSMKEWMVKMRNSVNNADLSLEEQLWKDASIYRVPAFVRDLSPDIFTPDLVSFGPYHHDNEELKHMEVHRERALVHFIRKAGKTLDEIVAAVHKVMKELQDSYYRLDKKWKSDKDGPYRFLKLMITDGCFMLEIFDYAANRGNSPTDPGKAYSPTDPFFSEHGVNHTMQYIKRDMLLIENQLPLLLLKTLVSVGRTTIPVLSMQDVDDHIHTLVLSFLKGSDERVEKMGLRAHTLDLLRHSLLRFPSTQTRQPLQIWKQGVIRSAVELREAGVKFRKRETKSFRDISFDPSKGILYLPELDVHDATECMLRNMVVFEHMHTNIDHGITSYVCFMDEIIDSAADVSLLHSKGIIQNSLGSDKKVAELFNNRITKEVTVDPASSLNEVRQKVRGYCQRRRNKWRANLCHTYFRNPWSMLSLAGALLVIVLTIVSTVFSGIQVHQGSLK